jgi:hypothetical protein
MRPVWRYHVNTDGRRQIDTAILRRGFLGWLRSERDYCGMAIPTIAEGDAKHPNRECESLVKERTRTINQMRAIVTQSRKLRDRKAVARYSGLTSSPDEGGRSRQEREGFRVPATSACVGF